MATKNYEITVDFTKQLEYRPTRFVRGDSQSYKFVVNTVQDISSNYIIASFRLPDGQEFIDDVEVVDTNEAELILKTELTSQVGKIDCQLSLFDSSSKLTSSVGFYFIVIDSISADVNIEISDNYPVLTTLINDVQGLLDNYQAAEDNRDEMYEQAELARLALYEISEGERDSDYSDAEDARDVLYTTAEGVRNTSYDQAETGRNNSYDIAENTRDDAYDIAETARDDAYDTAEGERDSQYNTAEDARDIQYTNAETARDDAYDIAEGERDILYQTAEDARDTLYQAAEDARAVWEDYDATTPYVVGNKVYYENNSYIATQTTTGNTPSLTSAFWQLIARGFDYEISINENYELILTRE